MSRMANFTGEACGQSSLLPNVAHAYSEMPQNTAGGWGETCKIRYCKIHQIYEIETPKSNQALNSVGNI